MLKTLDYFYYVNVHFSTDHNLVTVRKLQIPSFIQADKEVSPISLYERFRGGKLDASVFTELLCALNIQLLDEMSYLGKQ